MPRERRTEDLLVQAVDIAVAAIAASTALSVLAGLPLYADGAHYLFRLLVEDSLYVPDGRLAAVLPQLPALVVSRLGGEVATVRLAFALAYASLPVLSLWACWLILRSRASSLMLFVALAALLNQINLSGVSELLIVLYRTWPVALALALAAGAVFLSGLSCNGVVERRAAGFAPPSGSGCAALACISGPFDVPSRPCGTRLWRALASWFLLCTGTRLVLSLSGVSGYESSHLAGDGALWYLLTRTAAQHAILASVLVVGLLAASGAILSSPRPGTLFGWIAALLILVLVFLWGQDVLWGRGLRLKSGITFVVSLLLLACALLVAIRRRLSGGLPQGTVHGWAPALLVSLIAVSCLVGVKTTAWWTASRGLQNVISDSFGPCIRAAAVVGSRPRRVAGVVAAPLALGRR
jgi:hypothetical protein